MKKTLTLMMALVAIALVVSCGKDDDTTPAFIIDDTNLAEFGLNAYYVDHGSCCGGQVRKEGEVIIVPNDEYYMEFVITDGTFTVVDENVNFTEGENDIWISIRTYNDGTSFEPGTFNIWENSECSSERLNSGAWVNAHWMDYDYDYSGASGTFDLDQDGERFTFTFDGTMFDWNDYTGGPQRSEGCNWPYGEVDITGKVSATFTELPYIGD